jgi:uncharacterized membrane protein SpoIIM required for sporulation
MEVKTKSEKFVIKKKDEWEYFCNILTQINNRGINSINYNQIKDFPRLFRICCTDLAEAKTLKLSPDVIEYLNELVGQAHKHLYSFPAVESNGIKKFFTEKLPYIFIKNWIFILVSMVIFLSPFFITFYVVYKNPSYANLLIDKSTLVQMEDSYKNPIGEKRNTSLSTFAVTFYIQNNVSIAFASFALGVLLGIGTIYILLYNGMTLGAIFGYICGIGYGKNILHFVTAHTIFEITGLIVAGAAGLLLGFSIINATVYYRKESLSLQKNRIFTLVTGGALMVFSAAFIEGFISPGPLPYKFKVTIAVICGTFIVLYFFIYPLLKRVIK